MGNGTGWTYPVKRPAALQPRLSYGRDVWERCPRVGKFRACGPEAVVKTNQRAVKSLNLVGGVG